jgi:hypothetical protein
LFFFEGDRINLDSIRKPLKDAIEFVEIIDSDFDFSAMKHQIEKYGILKNSYYPDTLKSEFERFYSNVYYTGRGKKKVIVCENKRNNPLPRLDKRKGHSGRPVSDVKIALRNILLAYLNHTKGNEDYLTYPELINRLGFHKLIYGKRIIEQDDSLGFTPEQVINGVNVHDEVDNYILSTVGTLINKFKDKKKDGKVSNGIISDLIVRDIIRKNDGIIMYKYHSENNGKTKYKTELIDDVSKVKHIKQVDANLKEKNGIEDDRDIWIHPSWQKVINYQQQKKSWLSREFGAFKYIDVFQLYLSTNNLQISKKLDIDFSKIANMYAKDVNRNAANRHKRALKDRIEKKEKAELNRAFGKVIVIFDNENCNRCSKEYGKIYDTLNGYFLTDKFNGSLGYIVDTKDKGEIELLMKEESK